MCRDVFCGDDMGLLGLMRRCHSPGAITWEGVECALDMMQRLFGLVVDCSALRCVDIKLSIMNLHVSTVKFERYIRVLLLTL